MMLPLPFGPSPFMIIFAAACAIWAVPEWVGSAFQRARGNAQAEDRCSSAVLLLGIWVGVALDFLLALWVPAATILWHRTLLFALGILVILLGVALRWYAIRVLGRYFTRDVAIHPGQSVVQSGPYRYIRHPAYSGTLLTMLGLGLAMTNWVSLFAILACNFIGYAYRVSVEERTLCEKIGEPYIEYMRRTRRFIPFVY